MKSKKILIIEFADRSIKTAEVLLRKRTRVIQHISLHNCVSDITVDDIQEAFRPFSRKKYRRIIISLPRKDFLIRFLTLPSTDIAEIRKMFAFQLAKIVPYSLDEVIYDFSISQKTAASSKLSVFLIQKKRLIGLRHFIQTNKLTASAITVTSWGIHHWFQSQKRFMRGKKQGAFAVIDIDSSSAEVVVSDSGKFMFSRSFRYDNEHMLVQGILQSLQVFQKEFGKISFARVVFTGKKKPEVEKSCCFDDSVFIDSTEHFSLSKSALQEFKNGISFTSILGLSLPGDTSGLDFSFDFLKQKRKVVTQRNKFLQASFIGIQIFLLCSVFLFKYSYDKYAYLQFLNSQLEEIKVEAKALDVISSKLKIFDQEFKEISPFSDLLHKSLSAIPKDTQLTLLDFQENGDFSLKGYAEDISGVFVMVKALNKSRIFREVKIKYASKMKKANKELVEFYVYGKTKF